MEVGGHDEEINSLNDENIKKMDKNTEEKKDDDDSNTLTRDAAAVSPLPETDTPKSSEKNPEEKLQGWLHHRARGIGNLKGTRMRWFVFGDENCKLYYYRDPQDLLPVGEVSIATASFYFDGGNTEKPGQFQIKYVLE